MKDKELVKFLLKNIENISGQWKKKVTDEGIEAIDYYRAEELDLGEKKKKNTSKYVSATLSDAVDWAMTYFTSVFAGREDIFKTNPRSKEDVEAADFSEKIISYQLFTCNKWYQFVWDWIFDTLVNSVGVAKIQWYNEVENVDVVKENIGEEELAMLLANPNASLLKREIASENMVLNPNATSFLDSLIPVYTYNATIRYTSRDEYNLVESLPLGTIGFDLTTRDVDNLDFFYHRSDLKPFQIKKKYGNKTYKRIEKMADELKSNSYEYENKEFETLGGYSFVTTTGNEGTKDGPFCCYECFYIDPDTGSYMIANIIGEELLGPTVINKYGRIPIRALTAFREPHKIAGRSLHKKLKMFQRISTAIMRQLLNNLYYNNEGRHIISRDANVDLDAFENSSGPGSYILVDGDPNNAISSEIPPALQPWAFSLLERVQQEIEYSSGVPRSFKGIDVKELNKTFRGQMQQVKQASQILESMARSFSEIGFVPLVKDCSKNNIKFLSRTQSFRIANKFYSINPDNLIGDYDYTCNFGIGVENKDQIIMRMQQLLAIYAQIQKAGVPIITSQNVHYVMGLLIDAMGYKNTDDFITEPQIIEAVQGLVMAVMQHMQIMGQPIPELMQAIQAVVQHFNMPGMGGEKEEGKGSDGDQPVQASQPAQPMQPVLTPDSDNHFG